MVSDGPDFLSHRDLILSTRRNACRSEYLRRLDGLWRILLSRWPTRRLRRPPNPSPEAGPSIINLFLIRQRTGLWFKSHPVHFSVKGIVAAVLTRRLKVALLTTHSGGARTAAKGGINRAN